MNTQKWPNQMELKMSEQYLTEKMADTGFTLQLLSDACL